MKSPWRLKTFINLQNSSSIIRNRLLRIYSQDKPSHEGVFSIDFQNLFHFPAKLPADTFLTNSQKEAEIPGPVPLLDKCREGPCNAGRCLIYQPWFLLAPQRERARTMAEYREARRWISVYIPRPSCFHVCAYYAHVCISFFRMTYRRDYLDVDPSLRFEPITHREYTDPFSLFSLLGPCVCVSANASIIVAPAIFHRDARTKKKRGKRKKEKISRTRLKSHSVVWERKTSLFLFCRCPSSSTSPFGTRFPRVWINWNSIRTLV